MTDEHISARTAQKQSEVISNVILRFLDIIEEPNKQKWARSIKGPDGQTNVN